MQVMCQAQAMCQVDNRHVLHAAVGHPAEVMTDFNILQNKIDILHEVQSLPGISHSVKFTRARVGQATSKCRSLSLTSLCCASDPAKALDAVFSGGDWHAELTWACL